MSAQIISLDDPEEHVGLQSNHISDQLGMQVMHIFVQNGANDEFWDSSNSKSAWVSSPLCLILINTQPTPCAAHLHVEGGGARAGGHVVRELHVDAFAELVQPLGRLGVDHLDFGRGLLVDERRDHLPEDAEHLRRVDQARAPQPACAGECPLR